jgi:hypothetical protein
MIDMAAVTSTVIRAIQPLRDDIGALVKELRALRGQTPPAPAALLPGATVYIRHSSGHGNFNVEMVTYYGIWARFKAEPAARPTGPLQFYPFTESQLAIIETGATA